MRVYTSCLFSGSVFIHNVNVLFCPSFLLLPPSVLPPLSFLPPPSFLLPSFPLCPSMCSVRESRGWEVVFTSPPLEKPPQRIALSSRVVGHGVPGGPLLAAVLGKHQLEERGPRGDRSKEEREGGEGGARKRGREGGRGEGGRTRGKEKRGHH